MAHSPHQRFPARALVLALIATGSPLAMSAETRAFTPPPETYANPLPFMRHSFNAHAYNTLSCSVVYGNYEYMHYAINKRRPPPPRPNYQDLWKGGHLDIRNFPSPVEIQWTALDGSKHELAIDLNKVFTDQLVWHRVPRADMPHFYTGPSVPGGPQLDVEVNDRTVNVYTSMFIPTKAEQIPGNVHSNYRDDRFLAWTHTD